MEAVLNYICENAIHAHWIIFFLVLLGGLNIPISEDVMLIGGGAIASTCIPEHTIRLYIWIFLGCYLSAWEAYWIGRKLGPRLYSVTLFRSTITPERLDKLRHYYAKFGVFTFILGRFIPGGMRNALFMSCGLTRMSFLLFIIRDGIACLISTFILFNIGYHFGKHLNLLLFYFHQYTYGVLTLLLCLIVTGCIYLWYSSNGQRNFKN